MKLSCVSASYVNDLAGYPGEIDWGAAIETIRRAPVLETIEGILKRLAPARLDGIELWYPHVWPDNITPDLAGEVLDLLSAYGLVCCACAGSVGDPARDAHGCDEMFRVARLLKAPLIAGHFDPQAVPRLGAMAARHSIRLAYENSHEQDASQILSAIGEGNEWVGVNIDTGNMAAHGGDPVKAIRELGSRIIHVHFKDVPAAGSHECVALGRGIVDVAGVMRELRAIGYDGWLSIEVETGDRDPTAEILASAEMLRSLGA
jgi:sugar phosphate isomerase/epimerase